MKKYIIIVILSITLNSLSQTTTDIEGNGYKFKIDLPSGSTYDFKEISFTDEEGKIEYKSYLQLAIMLKEAFFYITIDKADFDKERLKKEWLTDDITKIIEETEHSLIIRTLENGTENYHVIFQKSIGDTSYLFVMYYQFQTLSEVQEVIKVLETVRE